MQIAYTLALESSDPDVGRTDYGFGFDSFTDADMAASEWAIEEWGINGFKKIKPGLYKHNNAVIFIESDIY